MFVFTKTASANPTRFFSTGVIWASNKVTRADCYGNFIWKIEVELPPFLEKEFIHSWDEERNSTYQWGRKKVDVGETWYSINSSFIKKVEFCGEVISDNWDTSTPYPACKLPIYYSPYIQVNKDIKEAGYAKAMLLPNLEDEILIF